ncbi:hypothetical protein [Variovorax sp. MHTC-1]|uniref:phosphoketolase family protein n=1 Tax=Variovorax sp. MHTC-1 TaxID=2495593 RepID=UPI000F86043D|nr:hypothetical protein [Variovorax sp. MHTC-1]RST50094.1 hypothetical protein EJI01_22000 [Variovorax sp. MHTC-1]
MVVLLEQRDRGIVGEDAQQSPDLKIRVVNAANLMALQSASAHPHGLADSEFDSVFTEDKPVIFAFHRYPWLIHGLIYERNNHDNFLAHGYREEGTTTIPFDITVLSRLDRLHPAADRPRATDSECREPCEAAALRDRPMAHRAWITSRGEDMPEILNWR